MHDTCILMPHRHGLLQSLFDALHAELSSRVVGTTHKHHDTRLLGKIHLRLWLTLARELKWGTPMFLKDHPTKRDMFVQGP